MTDGFMPLDRPRVAVTHDGTLAAIHEPLRVVVVEVPGCAAFAEVGIDPDATASEVAWVGAPPRVVVLARYPQRTVVHLVDPYGPRTIAELQLDAGMRLAGAVGAHALAIGPQNSVILSATDRELVVHPLPVRGVPPAAGAAGSKLVVGWAGVIEEWDPQTRMPARRIKLPRPVRIARVGGSDRVVWFMAEGEQRTIEVAPLVDRGQPRVHELPEPIIDVAGHPRSDLLVCLGADTGRIYVVDLDAREGMRVIGASGIPRPAAAGLVFGRMTGVLVAQAQQRIAIVALDGSTQAPRAESFVGEESSTDHGVPEVATMVTLTSSAPIAGDWREPLALWARAVLAGTTSARAPVAGPIEAVLSRFELAPALYPALALLYGAHLAGSPGVAPLDLARVLDHTWTDALGRGQLSARGLTVFEDSRVKLVLAVQRLLDSE